MFNFDALIDRRGTTSIKWDVPENELPMWIADMDFETAPCIRKALMERVRHGIFGYGLVPDEWYDAYISWWEKRHGFTMEKEWLLFVTGVVPAISSIVRKLTTPGENVLIQTPVYNIFFNSILNNGARVLESPLRYEDRAYSIDFRDLEKKLSDPQTTLMILCNPHNPVGRIWTVEELQRIGELCRKHHVIVISDEIHCDLVKPGCGYTPFQSVSDTCRDISITCIAPTKCFNIAGLQSAAVSVVNPALRHKVYRAINTDEIAEPGSFAAEAAVAAFTKGEPWLNALNAYVEENKKYVTERLAKELPYIEPVGAEATYLMWLDCTGLRAKRDLWRKGSLADRLEKHLRQEAGLYVASGSEYGSAGDDFLRMNVATSRSNVEEGVRRLIEGAESFLRH